MSLLDAWLPPTREHWELILKIWQFFPLITAAQWIVDFYPTGKTSIESRFNLPGKLGWMTMELPGALTLLYIMYTLPSQVGVAQLPWQNWTMAVIYTLHYVYRAIISPLLNPSMSPMHPVVWAMAVAFNVTNGLALGGWLGGHGPTWENGYWYGRLGEVEVGLILWGWGLMAVVFHDDDLREIRRAALRKQKRLRQQAEGQDGQKGDGQRGEAEQSQSVDKVYMLPKNGLFALVLHAHYFCEWLEWTGFWIVGGYACVPARTFLLNEISTMLPRALQGKRWYVEKFGREAVGKRKAVVPWLL